MSKIPHAFHQHFYTSYCLMTGDTQSSLYVPSVAPLVIGGRNSQYLLYSTCWWWSGGRVTMISIVLWIGTWFPTPISPTLDLKVAFHLIRHVECIPEWLVQNHLRQLVGKAIDSTIYGKAHPNVYKFVEVIQKEPTATEVLITQLDWSWSTSPWKSLAEIEMQKGGEALIWQGCKFTLKLQDGKWEEVLEVC